MKTVLFTAIATVIMFGSLFAQKDYSYLDNKKGTSMEPILARAEPLVKRIEDKDNEIVRMEYDLIFDTKSTSRTLYDGWTYGIVAFGDYRIKDIDLAVYKKSKGVYRRALRFVNFSRIILIQIIKTIIKNPASFAEAGFYNGEVFSFLPS